MHNPSPIDSQQFLAKFVSKYSTLSHILNHAPGGDKHSSDRPRLRITPNQQKSYMFAPDTLSWIKTCAISTISNSAVHECIVYKIPILGITNRSLPSCKSAGLNLFKTTVSIIAHRNVKNLDQCMIEFGPRFPISISKFSEELCRQMYLLKPHVKTKGRMIFLCSDISNIASTTDLQTLHLSATKVMPVINIDWLDPYCDWDLLWNPCSKLKPVKSKLENRLIHLLDKLIQKICASQCNVIIQRTNSFLMKPICLIGNKTICLT